MIKELPRKLGILQKRGIQKKSNKSEFFSMLKIAQVGLSFLKT